MRIFLIKLLFRLLEIELEFGKRGIITPEMQKWLAESYPHKGCRDYFAYREGKIMRQLAGGEGLSESREQYLMHMGQRVENLFTILQAKNAFLKAEKEKKNKETALLAGKGK